MKFSLALIVVTMVSLMLLITNVSSKSLNDDIFPTNAPTEPDWFWETVVPPATSTPVLTPVLPATPMAYPAPEVTQEVSYPPPVDAQPESLKDILDRLFGVRIKNSGKAVQEKP